MGGRGGVNDGTRKKIPVSAKKAGRVLVQVCAGTRSEH